MVLESTILCFDNSDSQIDGDFSPSRLQAQKDAANLVSTCKLRANPESTVGVVSMAPKPSVLSTATTDASKLFAKFHQVCLKMRFVMPLRLFLIINAGGEACMLTSVRVAALALKHRQNRSARMRVVVFVGSPLTDVDADELVKAAKKLKKEKCSVDVVLFGHQLEEIEPNEALLKPFIDALNGGSENGDSHLVSVASGTSLPEALLSSAVCRADDGTAPSMAMAQGGGGADMFDPNEDPELALALRVSLEEQRQRQAAEQPETAGSDTATPATAAPAVAVEDMDVGALTEEQQLEMAMRMSMQPNEEAAPAGAMEVDEDVTQADDAGGVLSADALAQIIQDLPSADTDTAAADDKKSDEKKEPKK